MLSRGWPMALALAWLVIAGTSRARAAESPFIVERWEEDLPQKSVITVTQTRDGYLWLGTLEGLVRFDGLRFTVFDQNNTPQLNSSRIVRLFEDNHSRLWIGTANAGIAVLENGRVQTTGLGTNGALAGASEDATGGVWLYNDDGQLWSVQGQTTNRFVFAAERYSVDGPARSIAAEAAGRIWVSADTRLASFRAGTSPAGDKPAEWLETPLPQRVDALLASRGGGVWRLAGGRIQKWMAGEPKPEFNTTYPWRNVNVNAVCEDRAGNLIVGTSGQGVFWFEASGRVTTLSTNEGLSHNLVLSLHVDREGSLWVGTDGGGLNRVKRRLFNVIEPTRGKVVQSVCAGTNGDVWMGFNAFTRNEIGAGVVKQGSFQGFGESNGLPFLSVRSVLPRNDGVVWVGTVGGVFLVRSDTVPPHIWAVLSLGHVQLLYEGREGRVWIGTSMGLARWDGREVEPLPALSGESVRALTEDAQGNVWVGTEKSGLVRLQGSEVQRFRRGESSLPNDYVTALVADAEGVLWVGTDGGGLARYHAGRWTRYSTLDGLAGNAISYLLEEGGQLWIGSSAGLMRVPKQELNDFAGGRISMINCRAYGRDEGLPTRECTRGTQPATWRGEDGRLWFATIQGLAWVDSAAIRPNTNPPPVVIEAVLIEGKASAEDRLARVPVRAVTMPARKQRLEIQYTSLNLAAPKRARFKYRLEGEDGGWTEVGDTRTVSFFKMNPGHYRFQVTACNEDGLWNPVPAEVAITVTPPFWWTWWFLTLTGLSLLGVVSAVVHNMSTQRLNRQLATLRQQEALERERARIARDIHDQLGANLTQVALLGELVEADKNSPTDIEEHARQISQTARETTRSLDEIVWTVNPANDTLEGVANYVCKYAQEYLAVAGLRCRLEVPPQLPAQPITPEIRHNVFLATREAVTNIVRHARATSAWLRLKLEPGRFTIEIEDDGRGPGDIDSERARTRNGLRNMCKRMEEVGGSFSIEPAPTRGTVVRLTAPFGRA